MPAKPPGYWDDGHILGEAERAQRQTLVAEWRAEHEEKTDAIFLKAKQALMGAGAREQGIVLKRQTLVRGIARDIVAEAGRGDYNILVSGGAAPRPSPSSTWAAAPPRCSRAAWIAPSCW